MNLISYVHLKYVIYLAHLIYATEMNLTILLVFKKIKDAYHVNILLMLAHAPQLLIFVNGLRK